MEKLLWEGWLAYSNNQGIVKKSKTLYFFCFNVVCNHYSTFLLYLVFLLSLKFQTRVRLEEKRVERLPDGTQFQKMEKDFDVNTERECCSCFYDLHFSAARCSCSPDKFTCLKHAHLVTCCDPENRIVLLRYTIEELKTLVEALEENQQALKVWISKDHGCDLGPKNLSDNIHEAHNKLFGVDLVSPNVTSISSMKTECIEDSVCKVSSADSDPERRASFCVEVVNLGSIVYGKLWSNKDAIFPKGMCMQDSPLNVISYVIYLEVNHVVSFFIGFKSRVMFFNICNPLIKSSYTSEVMDGGLLGPLFKVIALFEHSNYTGSRLIAYIL